MVKPANCTQYGKIAIATLAVGLTPITIAVTKCALSSYFVQEDPMGIAVQCMKDFEVAFYTVIPIALIGAFTTHRCVTNKLATNKA